MKLIEINHIPCTIMNVGTGRSATDAVIKMTLDASWHLGDVESLSPGTADKQKRMASEGAAGEETRIKGPRPEVSIKINAGDKEATSIVAIEQATLRGSLIRISKGAGKTEVLMTLSGAVSKAEWAALREAVYADCFADVTMRPAATKAPKRGKKKKPVDLVAVDPRQTSIPGTDAPLTAAEIASVHLVDGVADDIDLA